MQTIQERIASRKASLEEHRKDLQDTVYRDQLLNESIYLDLASYGLNEGIVPTPGQWAQFSNAIENLARELDRNSFKVTSFLLQLTATANTYAKTT